MSGNAPAPVNTSNTPGRTLTGTSEEAANSLVNVDTSKADKVGVFTTAQSLITFPGAVAAVTTIWKVLVVAYAPLGEGKSNKIGPVVISLIIGLFIYVSSVTQDTSWKDRLSSFGVALVNSFTIAAAALGIS
jgi:hypothetical protein